MRQTHNIHQIPKRTCGPPTKTKSDWQRARCTAPQTSTAVHKEIIPRPPRDPFLPYHCRASVTARPAEEGDQPALPISFTTRPPHFPPVLSRGIALPGKKFQIGPPGNQPLPPPHRTEGGRSFDGERAVRYAGHCGPS